jgi:hypothetical protein
MEQNAALRKPFFVQFLEGQNRHQEDTQGSIPWPWPWPGTAPAKDNLETHKAPSDNDEEIFI